MDRDWRKIGWNTAAVFFFGALIYAVGAATRAAVPGMIFDVIRAELGYSAAETAGIASAGVFGCMAFIGISGILIDRFGWRKLILCGVFFQVLGEYLLYSNTAVAPVYAGAFLNGGGRTIGYLALLKFLDTEFDRRYFSVLIGVFYLFSYGGTLLGTSPFELLTRSHSWQSVLRGCNALTVACGIAVALLLWRNYTRPAVSGVPAFSARSPGKFPWRELLEQLRKRQCLAIFYVTSAGLVIYWSILGVAAKKYLADVCGTSAAPLGVMNAVVMAEMILGGSVSYLCGNRRKIFQFAGALLLVTGTGMLFTGCFVPPSTAKPLAWIGFAALGSGYGFTCVNITAVREFVPPRFAASAIGFVNFCANVVMIAMTQIGGMLFDRFPASGLHVSPEGYRMLFGLYLLLALPAVFAAASLRDSRGTNISAELR